MALKQADKDKLKSIHKLDVDKLIAAIKDDNEVDFSIEDNVTVLTDAEIDTLKTNEYNSGKVKGVEIAVKDTKEKLGLDFQGKTIDGLITSVKEAALKEAKIAPDTRVTELQDKLTNIQNTVKEYESKMTEKETALASLKINTELAKYIPTGTILEPEDVISLMRTKGYDFKMENGKLIPVKDGKELTDKLSNAMEAKSVVESFVTERKLVNGEKQDPTGRGGGDKKPSIFTKMSEVEADFKAQGKSSLGEEFATKISELKKADENFDMNS